MTKFYNNKKNLVIIGSSGRIGHSLLMNELEKGNNVVGIDLNQKINKTLQNKNYFFIKSDISRKKNLNKAFQTIYKKFGNIDIVVNCSYPKSKQFGKNFEDLDEKYLKQDLYNQIGISILISQISIKFFLKQKYGNLILLSSIQGISAPKFEHYKNTNMVSPIEYSASKAGIISITKYLAKKYMNKNIRVNCLSPGGIDDNQPKIFKKKYRKDCNTVGLLKPDDLIGAFNFLISDHSKYVTGQNIIVDDGWSL